VSTFHLQTVVEVEMSGVDVPPFFEREHQVYPDLHAAIMGAAERMAFSAATAEHLATDNPGCNVRFSVRATIGRKPDGKEGG